MDLKVIDKKRNEVIKRNEVVVQMHEKMIPAKKQIREKLASILNIAEETLVITKVESKFGSSKAKVYARAYDSPEELKKIEVKYIRERNFGKEKKVDVASGPEAPPANFKK